MRLTQKISEVFGSKTGEYAAAAKKDFMECLKKEFLAAAVRIFQEKNVRKTDLLSSAMNCFEEYFQAMKGALSLRREEVEVLVEKQISGLEKLRSKLLILQKHFSAINVPFVILSPCFSSWDTGFSPCVELQIDNTPCLAFPLVHAKGTGKVLFIEEDCVIVMSEFPACLRPFQYPSVWAKEFGGEFCHNFVETDKKLSEKEVNELMQKHKVAAVVKRAGKQLEIVTQATNIYTF